MSAKEQLLDITYETSEQTLRIRAMNRTANETQQTSNNIMQGLGKQREVIIREIETNDKITDELKKADAKTNEMTRRSLCIKCTLYIIILALLAAIVGLMINKFAAKS